MLSSISCSPKLYNISCVCTSEQGQNKGIRAVEMLIQCESTEASLQTGLGELLLEQARTARAEGSVEVLALLDDKIAEVKLSVEKIRARIQHQKQMLSVRGDGSLDSYNAMQKDQFLALRLNLNAIRERIVAMIRARKFELTNLDRAYRSRTLGMDYLNLSCVMLRLIFSFF
jgi:hypothetical protein